MIIILVCMDILKVELLYLMLCFKNLHFLNF